MASRQQRRTMLYDANPGESADQMREERVQALVAEKRRRAEELAREEAGVGLGRATYAAPGGSGRREAQAAAEDRSGDAQAGASDSSDSVPPTAKDRKRERKHEKERKHKKEKHKKEKKQKAEKRSKKERRHGEAREEPQRSIITGKRLKLNAGSVADEEGEARRERLRGR